MLKFNNKYIGLRRQSIPSHETPPKLKDYPKGCLFFCHNLIRFAESIEQAVKRIVKEQTGTDVKSYRVIDIESSYQEKDSQWAFCPYVIVQLEQEPKTGNYGNEITEVVEFTKDTVPSDFGWWSKEELEKVLKKFD